MLSCEAVEALIALEDYPTALQLLTDVQRAFPRALRPQQLTGLALARSGDWQQAQIVLGRLYAAGEIDPETLGIYGRTWMDRYNITKDRLHLLRARDLYRQAFEAAPKDYYTGINAAAKSLLLGNATLPRSWRPEWKKWWEQRPWRMTIGATPPWVRCSSCKVITITRPRCIKLP